MGEQRIITPRDLIQGDRGAFAQVSGCVASILERGGRIDELRRQLGGRDRELDVTLEAIRVVALRWRGSEVGTGDAAPSEPAALSEWMTTDMVAHLLEVGPRAITKAIARGRLKAEKADGRWRIHRHDLAEYRTRHTT